ncbi:hypothetical protein VPNG_03964 [Cytospora leucostoma]|uniref:USP domain-containing protein n=1 Tax=Cytospora leucostoma TaxID=1230097 RepID=A0A423XE37_9PEZI|nr:hypothetical protein VPNG_03964 [Cytospora leucostoma]
MEPASRSPTESRERAVSSEPGSTRPNPFDDDGSSARKRRRTSVNGASRSRSVESQKPCHHSPEDTAEGGCRRQTADQDVNMTMDSSPSKPQTPEHQQEHAQPVSESKPTRITLNLKNRKHPPQPVSSSPISLKDIEAELQEEQENGIRLSVEASDLDISHASPQSAEPVSLPLDVDDPDGPPIESVDIEEEYEDELSQVSVLQFSDPMAEFPHHGHESLMEALVRVCHLLPTHATAAPKMREWMECYMTWAKEVDDIYALFQHYEHNREFLSALPKLIWESTSPLKTTPGRIHQSNRHISALHKTLAKLTAFFVDFDLLLLRQSEAVANNYQELTSAEYILFLHQLLIEYGGQAVNVSSLDADSLWPDSFRQLLEGFRSFRPVSESITSGQSLCNLGYLLAGLVPRFPRMLNSLHSITQMAAVLVRDSIHRLQLSPAPQEVEDARNFLDLGYPLFETVSESLTACINKSVNQIPTEIAELFIYEISSLLRLCLRSERGQAGSAVKEHLRNYPDIPPAFTVDVMVDEWRLTTLTKFIVSSQMQLRLSAAHIMCADLVRIFKEHQAHGGDYSQQPLLRHFSNTLIRSGVVAYILGPTCHPEVTATSANIIGFLFASHTFTEEHMECMWQTVTTCQISGVSEALVSMLINIAQYFTVTDLLSICRKLQTVPIEAFNPNMRELCNAVMQHLTTKHEGLQELLPHSLMFRLLRESSAPGPPFYQVIQRWGANTIPQLLRYGPSYEDKSLLYQECLRDITQKTPYTLGSLHGLSLLCRPVARELQVLTSQYDLPKLLVDELEHAISTRQDYGVAHVISGPENAPRLELLISVICHEPDAIIGDLGARLWELLVGKLAASQEDRDCAWHCLSKALKSHRENQFLKICFDEYLPTLPPQSLCPGALDFVLQKILHIVDAQDSVVLDDDDESGDRSAIEHLWRIILTAPSGTIEARAIMALVQEVYVESRCILSFPKHRARKVHLALVNRCMKQMSSAARHLKNGILGSTTEDPDAMAVTIDEPEGSEYEIIFSRSLAILRQFHRVYQQTPLFSTPDVRSLILPEKSDAQGDSAELKFQSFDGDTQTEVKPLTIGRRNTAGSLLAGIRDATGFSNYRLYYKGQAFTPSEQDVCRSLDDLQIYNGLILVRRESDAADHPVNVRPGASPVEVEIMRHFEELWQYLGLEERLASEIYAFLVTLPVDGRILTTVGQRAVTYQEIFPVGQPLKSLYALYAIQEYLDTQSSLSKSKNDAGFYERALLRALTLIVCAICDRDVVEKGSGAELKILLALRLVELLLAILRDPLRPSPPPEGLNYTLVERLLEILDSCFMVESTLSSTNLLNATAQAILDTCSLNPDLWGRLCSQADVESLIQKLLLDDPREVVRKSAAGVISEKVAHSFSTSAVPATAFRDFFWATVYGLIPHALTRPTACSEFFHLAMILFKSARESKSAALDLPMTVHKLSQLLLGYQPREVRTHALGFSELLTDKAYTIQDIIQPGTIDLAAHGLVNLLHCMLCDTASQASSEILPPYFGSDLFWHHLFPRRLSRPEEPLWQGDLIYNEATRRQLNDIMLKVSARDTMQNRKLIEDLQSLVPCLKNDEEDGGSPYRYDLPFSNFDRSKAIRSACGYSGLRNLSNTCYLNSLCTQLFMNIDFRQFMLNVAESGADKLQSLLHHTRTMFGQLQSSHRRFIDPEAFVASIKTYDDEGINIHNQMDVEEFFNLLADRLEGQLRSQEAVQSFRSFYGGQLVTQTKSKECEHLSEVMEPFSAIQCDIKGKKDLFESLDAYVDGEHMEGDNKYKCSNCDRHVDAVRRSCLKEIPDSLIFHLKRFDFNLRTQARNKINDYFAFPSRIDMRPYTIEHLSDSSGDSSEDWFELVGVLVHAGTAESGHYYSYIRERPTSRENEDWFEFNDDTVTPWNPLRMEASCYGGSEPSWDANGMSYEKNYCAYMLFYERSSALERKQRELQRTNSSSPIQVQMPPGLALSIRQENLRILQRHCLFDPDHVRIADAAIEQMLDLNRGVCSEDHITETAAVEMALGHLDQVAARGKDAPGAKNLTDRLQEMADNCAHCAFDIYQYFSDRHECFRYLVQRNSEPAIRQSVVDLLILALGSMKEAYPDKYNAQAVSPAVLERSENNVIHGVCVMFEALWENFHVTFKSWFEVFYLMAKFVALGKQELLAFLGHKFLEKTVLILVADNLSPQEMNQQFTRLGNTLTRRQNRPPTFATIIELLSNIFASITADDPVVTHVQREKAFVQHPEDPIRLVVPEVELLQKPWDGGCSIFLDKLIFINQNHEATDAIFARILEERWQLEEDVLLTLLDNTKAQASFVLHAPYLRVAALYCHVSHQAANIDQLIKHIAKHSRLLANSEPKAVLGFFRNKAVIDGDRVNSGELRGSTELQYLEYLQIWVPGLLAHYDPSISMSVEQVLHEKIFIYGPTPTFEEKHGGQERAEAVVLSAQYVGLQCLQYIHENYIRRGNTVPAQTVTVLQRVLNQCGSYFDAEDDSPGGDVQKFFRFRQGVLDNLRRLSVDDLEDDGSGMSDSESLLSDPASISPISAPEYQELTFLPNDEDWENSVASSDQMESLGDDDINTMDM